VRFEVIITVKIEFMVFWVVVPCSVVAEYEHFRELCCLHLLTSCMTLFLSLTCSDYIPLMDDFD